MESLTSVTIYAPNGDHINNIYSGTTFSSFMQTDMNFDFEEAQYFFENGDLNINYIKERILALE